MISYIFKRLIFLIPILLIVAIITFLLIHIAPGDPVSIILGADATQQEYDEMREELGLNDPLFFQLLQWLKKIISFDLGHSFFLQESVLEAIIQRLPVTLTLATLSILFASVFGIISGVIAAINRNNWIDYFVITGSILGLSIPSFWLGLTFILVFAVKLGWFPSGGYIPMWENFFESLKYMIMPSISLGLMHSALIARMTRSCMLEILSDDFIRTIKAKGLNNYKVYFTHALRNAIVPVLAVIGVSIGQLLGGSVIIEMVFTLPGIGRMVIMSVLRRDYQLIQGSLIFIAFSYVLVNLLVDILYTYLDPRIKYD